MEKYESCLEVFNCKSDDVQEFEVNDSFNDGMSLSGFICRVPDHRYGALFIDKINQRPINPQIVYGAPKMHYPFDRQGTFKWPSVNKVNVYNKLDGTNIVAYTYTWNGHTFVTFKTRLQPIVRSGKFGPFREMLLEMLQRYDGLQDTVKRCELNLSFELWGARNRHLLIYDVPLELTLLFGIKPNSDIVDPESIPCDFPRPIKLICNRLQDLTGFYKELQSEASKKLSRTDFGFEGDEGYVLYAHGVDGVIRQFKAKPEEIEKIHFASGGISSESIRATCFNAYEQSDEPSFELVKQLLLEEYDAKQISAREDRTKEILKEVCEEMIFRRRVLDVYNGLGISLDDGDPVRRRLVMQKMSQFFGRKEMKYVFWIVKNCSSK